MRIDILFSFFFFFFFCDMFSLDLGLDRIGLDRNFSISISYPF